MNHQNFMFTANNSSSHDMVVQTCNEPTLLDAKSRASLLEEHPKRSARDREHVFHDHRRNHLPPFDSLITNNHPLSSSSYQFAVPDVVNYNDTKTPTLKDGVQQEEEELSAMKEMLYRIAVMQPIDIDPATVRRPKRRNVHISDDPQSVAARHRRERISEKIEILKRLVPGGTKMDTASMLEEATGYIKFLKRQIRLLQENHDQPSIVESVEASEQWQLPVVSSYTGSAVGPPPPVVHAVSFGNSMLNFNPEVIRDN